MPIKALKTWFTSDALRAYQGHQEDYEDHGEDEHGVQGSMEKHEDQGDITQHVSSTKEMPKMPFDPLKMPLGPMTRARAKRFKEALLGLIRVHLEELKAIGDHLKPIGDHHQRNIPIDSKLCILLEIDEH